METKFRAFQLNTDGSLFSFYKPNLYTLIEARIPKDGIDILKVDLSLHGKEAIDLLHITSWDNDHCNYEDLIQILNHFRPAKIEIPDYIPDSDTGKLCLNTINGYEAVHERYKPNVQKISQEYLETLKQAPALGTNDVAYASKFNATKKNDMSLVRLFRSEGFNVFSLGDCECPSIGDRLTYPGSLLNTEVDILILPHHGADNGFITESFLDKIKPIIAVCSSNYGNQYDHPKQEIRDLLYKKQIPLYTTKTGDIWILHKKGEDLSGIYNMKSDNTDVSSSATFRPKRHQIKF